jgi:hypothetical protein
MYTIASTLLQLVQEYQLVLQGNVRPHLGSLFGYYGEAYFILVQSNPSNRS